MSDRDRLPGHAAGDGGAELPRPGTRDAASIRRSRLRRLLWPGLMTVAMLTLLLLLGTWQVERLAWKTALLADVDRAEAAPAVPLGVGPPAPFTKVRVQGRYLTNVRALYGAAVRDVGEGPQMGADLLMPLERADGPPVLVDRGWVPEKRRSALPLPGGDVVVEGYVRPREKPGLFSPADDLAMHRFYTLNPPAIGAAIGVPGVAPFTLVALGGRAGELYPDPARRLPRPDNNHLSYAITWYGLAVALLVIFGVWAAKALRA